MRPLNAAASKTSTAAIASSATVVNLFAADEQDLGRTIFNDSSSILHVKFGSGASATDKAVEIAPNGYYEVPFHYIGLVTGLWDAANGFAYCTKFY